MTAPTAIAEHPDIAKLKAAHPIIEFDDWSLQYDANAIHAAIDRAYAIGLAQLPPEIDRLAREWAEADWKWLTWYGPNLELRRLGDNKARARAKLLHALRGMVTR